MKTILAHLKKDIALFRPLLWIWAVCVGIDGLSFFNRFTLPHTNPHLSAGGAGLILVGSLSLALVVIGGVASLAFQLLLMPFLIVRVIHADPLTEPDAFWRTRPISKGALLTEKALFIALLLAGALFAALATKFHSGNASRTVMLLQAAVFVSGLVAFAAVTSNFSKLILTFMSIALGAGILASMLLGWERFVVSTAVRFHFPLSGHLLFFGNPGQVGKAVLLLACYLTVIVYQYLTLKTNFSRGFLFATFFLAALLQGG